MNEIVKILSPMNRRGSDGCEGGRRGPGVGWPIRTQTTLLEFGCAQKGDRWKNNYLLEFLEYCDHGFVVGRAE